MYTQEIADTICSGLAEGKSLRSVCGAPGMPAASTVLLWVNTNTAFAEQYARARELGYALLADEIIDISDDGINDSWTDDDGVIRTNQDVIARSRLRVDSRKWMLSKMLPKVYGEKLTTEVTGGLKHDHTVGLSAETSELLASLKAGSSHPGDAAPVQD